MKLSCDSDLIMVLVFYNRLRGGLDMKGNIGGPFLQVAAFCEKVLNEQDGVISAIRIVDRMTFTLSGKEAPEKMPPMNLSITLLVRFKSGDAPGKYELNVKPVSPSGKQLPTFTFPFVLGGGELSANMILGYNVKVEETGIYWFEILLGKQSYTKVSLNVIYERQQEVLATGSSAVH
jgi:hypothetical protein